MHPAIIAERDATLRRHVIDVVSRDVCRVIDRSGLGPFYRHVLEHACEWSIDRATGLARIHRRDTTLRAVAVEFVLRPVTCVITYRPDVEGD